MIGTENIAGPFYPPDRGCDSALRQGCAVIATIAGMATIVCGPDRNDAIPALLAIVAILTIVQRVNPRPAIDVKATLEQYVAVQHTKILDRELKKGSAELLILALVEHRPRHGYEICQVIEDRSEGAVRFRVASLYPLLYRLYRLEKRGWIQGRWVEKAGQRRRRYYRLTVAGRQVLADQRSGWDRFVAAIKRIAEAEHA
jgi:PadR family transcriptional regulator, regulatory protein PadR